MPFEFTDYNDPLFYVTYGLILLLLLVLILFIVILKMRAGKKKTNIRYNSADGEVLIFNGNQVFHIDPSGDTEVYTLLENEKFGKGPNVYYHKEVKIVQVNDEDGVLVRNQSFERIHVALDFDGKKKIRLGEKEFVRK